MQKSVFGSPILFNAPWNIIFEDRLAALTRPGCRRRVAYYYDVPDTSTFRYRVFNMVATLNAQVGDVAASWFCRADLDKIEYFIEHADVLIIARACYTFGTDWLISRAKMRGIPVYFDCDDLVFNTDYVHLVANTLDQNLESEAVLDSWFARISRHGALMKLCDGAIVTNAFLARQAEAFLQKGEARIVPNYLNREQQKISTSLYNTRRINNFKNDGRINIGYFSGSPTHNHDFAIAAPALAQLMNDDSRIHLRIVGFLEMKGDLAAYSDRIEFLPLQDYLNLQRLIAEVEINIAPLQSNLFTNCKSELKYFEAAIVGTVTVASPSYTFQKSIADGENGFLSATYEWDAKLRRACALVDKPEAYIAMARSGFRHTVQNYSWDIHAATIMSAVFRDDSIVTEMSLASPLDESIGAI